MFGSCVEGVLKVSRGCLKDVWMVSRGCPEGYLDGVSKVSGTYGKVCGRCLKGIWKVLGICLAGVWKV